jgi:hypothetical protein
MLTISVSALVTIFLAVVSGPIPGSHPTARFSGPIDVAPRNLIR